MRAVVTEIEGVFGPEVSEKFEPYEYLKDSRGNDIFCVSDDPQKSCTKYISYVLSNGITFCDCPGFEDADGFVDDMVHSALIGKLFNEAHTVTIMITIDYPSMCTVKGKIVKELFIAVSKLLRNST